MTEIELPEEELFRALVEASPAAIGITLGGKLVYVNPAGLRLLGASDPSEVLGMGVTEFAHADEQAVVTERVRRGLTSTPPLRRCGWRRPPT